MPYIPPASKKGLRDLFWNLVTEQNPKATRDNLMKTKRGEAYVKGVEAALNVAFTLMGGKESKGSSD